MALNFEKIITPSRDGPMNFLGNEPENSWYQYYVTGSSRSKQTSTQITLANYDDLPWADPEVLMTPREVSRIGVKTFPQIGAIGFYKLKYRDLTRIMAPIHTKTEKGAAPTLQATVSEEDKTVTFTITPPEDTTYECYRIEMELIGSGTTLITHVTYDLTDTVEIPEEAGDYDCTAIGYNLEGQVCSEDSNAVTLTLAGNAKERGASFPDREEMNTALDQVGADISSVSGTLDALKAEVNKLYGMKSQLEAVMLSIGMREYWITHDGEFIVDHEGSYIIFHTE